MLEAPEFPLAGLVWLPPVAITPRGCWLFLLLLLDGAGGRGMMLIMSGGRGMMLVMSGGRGLTLVKSGAIGTYPNLFMSLLAAWYRLGIGGKLPIRSAIELSTASPAPLPPSCMSL